MGQVEPNGVKINYALEGQGATLVLLHGFTGSHESWLPHTAIYNQQYRTLAPDALGHGLSDSPDDPERYGFSHIPGDFVALLGQLGLDKVALLGYSMGGRMALQIAVSVPERVSVLIIESASPGILELEAREQRIVNDNQIAQMIEQEGVKAFVDYWEKAPIFVTQKGLAWEVLRRQREQRLKNNPTGLANSLRGAGAGQQQPLHAKLPNLKMPVLLLAGQYDEKYIELATQMHNLIPTSQLKIVGGTGHTIHLERPQEYDRLVLEFLDNVKF